MRTIVVYESSFGNTRKVAEAVAEELDAELVHAGEEEPDLEDVELLVVGAPTHVHGLPGERSRQAAVEQGGIRTARGVREWLDELPERDGCLAAAFDTRADKPMFVTGSAAKGIAKRLSRHGYRLATPPESFVVHGTEGPLEDGELERAEAWGWSLRRATPRSDRPLAGTAQRA